MKSKRFLPTIPLVSAGSTDLAPNESIGKTVRWDGVLLLLRGWNTVTGNSDAEGISYLCKWNAIDI